MAAPVDPSASVRLHQLEGFYYVGAEQGFARAVRAMPYPITEPALHQQVRKLERSLGARLLERGPGRRMVLTPEGRALHAFIRPYFLDLPGVLRAATGRSAGELVVATEPLFVEGICAAVLAGVRRRFPLARLRLAEMDGPEMAEEILRGRIDLGIASSLAARPSGLRFEAIGVLGLELLAPRGHPLARLRPPIDPQRLAGHGYILYSRGTEERAFSESVLTAAGLSIHVAAETTSAAALRSLVGAGLWPAFVPTVGRSARARRASGNGMVAFDLTDFLERAAGLPRFGLLRRAGRGDSPLAACFADEARAVSARAGSGRRRSPGGPRRSPGGR
jgi:LysR family transcriptional regulator, benzoate and cis,cis-muconate-responsive activator of ben and cat genes